MKTPALLTSLALLAGVAFGEETKIHPKEEAARLMERARDAKAAGRHDEARELAEKAEHVVRVRREREIAPKDAGKPVTPHAKGPEAERLRHVAQALEHLHAAGLHEPARHVEEIAHQLRREMEERTQRESVAARNTHPDQSPLPQAELEELRRQMRRMAEQIEHLQAEMQKKSP
jgi:hypothetical protein